MDFDDAIKLMDLDNPRDLDAAMALFVRQTLATKEPNVLKFLRKVTENLNLEAEDTPLKRDDQPKSKRVKQKLGREEFEATWYTKFRPFIMEQRKLPPEQRGGQLPVQQQGFHQALMQPPVYQQQPLVYQQQQPPQLPPEIQQPEGYQLPMQYLHTVPLPSQKEINLQNEINQLKSSLLYERQQRNNHIQNEINQLKVKYVHDQQQINSRLQNEKDQLQQLSRQLQNEKDHLQYEKNQLQYEKDELQHEKDQLQHECDRLMASAGLQELCGGRRTICKYRYDTSCFVVSTQFIRSINNYKHGEHMPIHLLDGLQVLEKFIVTDPEHFREANEEQEKKNTARFSEIHGVAKSMITYLQKQESSGFTLVDKSVQKEIYNLLGNIVNNTVER
jgi:hypothetical protein